MKVLISGAGVAGNALAFWLVRLGHDVTIVEQFSSLRATGLQVDLRGHGVSVLKKMGLEQAYKALSPPEQGIQFVNSSGRKIGYFPANTSGKGLQSLTTEHEIMRGDFCRLMYDANKDRAKYVFGTSIKGLTNDHKAVQVDFDNGTTDRFDLVVGADGVYSRTRTIIGMDGFYPCKGMFVAYMTAPSPMADGERYDATGYLGVQRGIMLRRHSPTHIQIYMANSSASPELIDTKRGSEEEKEAFARSMRGAGWRVDELLDRFDEMPDFYCERLGLVILDSWSSGRMTLLGDAAYCPSAQTGMGTTSALVGAYVLAGELSKHADDVPLALKAYEKTFRPFMSKVQDGLLDRPNIYPQSSFGVLVWQFAIALAAFFRVDVMAKWFLRESEDVGDWVLPEYEALVVERK